MVGAESVRAGQVVLDVGIHVGADGNLCGDTRYAEVEPVVEARYSRLTREFPERAEGLFTRNEDAAKERYEHLTKLIDLYDKQ